MSLDRSIKCPYWIQVRDSKIYCEGDIQEFQSYKNIKAYTKQYCSCFKGMTQCSIYKQLDKYYRKETLKYEQENI